MKEICKFVEKLSNNKCYTLKREDNFKYLNIDKVSDDELIIKDVAREYTDTALDLNNVTNLLQDRKFEHCCLENVVLFNCTLHKCNIGNNVFMDNCIVIDCNFICGEVFMYNDTKVYKSTLYKCEIVLPLIQFQNVNGNLTFSETYFKDVTLDMSRSDECKVLIQDCFFYNDKSELHINCISAVNESCDDDEDEDPKQLDHVTYSLLTEMKEY